MAKKDVDSLTAPTRTIRRSGQRFPSEQARAKVQETFLAAFAESANVTESCQRAGISRTLVYEWLEKQTEFTIRYHDAERRFYDRALAEFTRRAMQGYEEVVTNNRGIVYWPDGTPVKKRVVSDRLLELIIKRGFPEYRDKQQVELTGKDGEALQVQVTYVNDWRQGAEPEDTTPDAASRANRRP